MDTNSALQLYRLMFSNIRIPLALVRIDPGASESFLRIVDLNRAAMNLSGHMTHDFQNHRQQDYFPGLFKEDFQQTCSRIAKSGGSADLGEAVVGKGCYRIEVFRLHEHYLGIMFSDKAEQKKAEAEIAQLSVKVQEDAADLEKRVAERTAQLEEINAELDSFAYSVSHDLRAPLRAVKGFGEILLEDQVLSEAERVDYLKRILLVAQSMDRLIQNLLAYSRLSRQEIMLHAVSLEKVVREAAEQLELSTGGKSYRLEVSGELPEVVGHHAVLVQVVLNLLTNAIKFVPRGVVPELRIWAEEAGDHCRLFVEDNGIGIPPRHQERIFQIFERLQGIDVYPGTGIGLAIVRKSVLRLGGRIGVESREGEGSRFWIELLKPGTRD